MDFALNDIQVAVRDTAQDFSRRHIRPEAARWDREKIFPAPVLKQMAELGLMGVNIPSQYGGSEAGIVSFSVALTEIARECAGVAVTMSVTNMVAETIADFGTEEQKEKYLPLITSGDYPAGSFALTEPGVGSDATSLKTTYIKDGDDLIINGSKQFITSGAYSGVTIVMARNPEIKGGKGISAFLVEKDTPGFSVDREEEKMGIKCSNTVSLSLEDCRINKKQLLGKEGQGFKIAMTALDGGRIGVASQAIGLHQAALEAAARYANERVQFGKPLSANQAIQWMVADMATQLEAARLLTLRAAYLKDKGEGSCTCQASMAKLFASEVANQACIKAVQIHGGYGFTGDFPVEKYFRDAKTTTIYEGTSEIQRLVIARNIIGL